MPRGLRGVRRRARRPRWQPASSSVSPGARASASPRRTTPGINGLVIPTPTPGARRLRRGCRQPLAVPRRRGRAGRTTSPGTHARVVASRSTCWTTRCRSRAWRPRRCGPRRTSGSARRASRPVLRPGRGRQRLAGRLGHRGRVLACRRGRCGGGTRDARHPRLGDGWLSYDVPGLPRASATIEDQSSELVQLRNEADTTTRTVYEKGVGLVGVDGPRRRLDRRAGRGQALSRTSVATSVGASHLGAAVVVAVGVAPVTG